MTPMRIVLVLSGVAALHANTGACAEPGSGTHVDAVVTGDSASGDGAVADESAPDVPGLEVEATPDSPDSGDTGGPDEPGAPATFVALDLGAIPERPSERTFATTLHVVHGAAAGGDGSSAHPFATIVAAVRAASAASAASGGLLIRVGPGTYPEWDDDTGHAFTLGVPDVVVAGDPGAARPVITPGAGSFGYGVQLAAAGTALWHLEVRGFASVGVELGGRGAVTNLALEDVRVESPVEGIVAYEDLGGAHTTPTVSGLRLEGVEVVGPSLIGISCNVGPCVDVLFRRVHVTLQDGGSGSSGADGVAFERGARLWFDHLTVEGAGADGLDVKGVEVLVTGTIIRNVGRNGLKLWHGGDVQNTIVNHTGADAAVVFDGPGRYRVLNSVVAHHLEGQSGAYTMTVAYDTTCGDGGIANRCCRTDSGDTTGLGPRCDLLTFSVENSLFTNNSGPISIPVTTGVRFASNAFGPFAEGAVLEVRAGDHRYQASELAGAGLAIGTIVGTPGIPDLIDLVDFRPRAPGALVDAGVVSDPMPATDLGGGPRVRGAAPDLGPWEVE